MREYLGLMIPFKGLYLLQCRLGRKYCYILNYNLNYITQFQNIQSYQIKANRGYLQVICYHILTSLIFII